MNEKPACKVCGSRRQRNLMPILRFPFSSKFDFFGFLTRMEPGLEIEETVGVQQYICYRCYINPDAALVQRSHNKKPYRYQDIDEKVEANTVRRTK